MNDDKIAKFLYDILVCTERVESFFEGGPKIFEDFNKNYMMRQAVERNIEIMGEAMKNILQIDPDIRITNARKIVDARNYIIHAYDSLSADILWSIVINHIPLLHDEVKMLLGIDD